MRKTQQDSLHSRNKTDGLEHRFSNCLNVFCVDLFRRVPVHGMTGDQIAEVSSLGSIPAARTGFSAEDRKDEERQREYHSSVLK